MTTKKIVVAVVIILVAIGGFVSGLLLLRENQDLREEAAVPGGDATVSIQPESGTFSVGDTINMSVYFNTANIAISGIEIKLLYPFTGSSPQVTVSNIEVNSSLLSTGDWTCPTQNASQSGGNVVIDIGCADQSSAGFSSSSDTLLANIDLQINSAPSTSPLVVRFDPASSRITRKSNNEDILLIPASTGNYTIGGGVQATSTPTNTQTPSPTGQVTTTTTPTLTSTPTPTKVSTASATLSPTTTAKGGELPDAGVSYPTIIGIGLGILMLAGALLLAL